MLPVMHIKLILYDVTLMMVVSALVSTAQVIISQYKLKVNVATEISRGNIHTLKKKRFREQYFCNEDNIMPTGTFGQAQV